MDDGAGGGAGDGGGVDRNGGDGGGGDDGAVDEARVWCCKSEECDVARVMSVM